MKKKIKNHASRQAAAHILIKNGFAEHGSYTHQTGKRNIPYNIHPG